ncbi:MAG: hypothetical protein LBF49_00700 [Puniceicoccales bacterium]|jgi:hypothetical protein|nr:hypothetical protein [Puniceicoccales bacterium]
MGIFQIDANVIKPGPTGVVGDMKVNPLANPNIPQNDVGSTQHVSRESTEITRPGTKAFEGKQKLDSDVLKTVMLHGHGNPSGANPQANPSESAEYGK